MAEKKESPLLEKEKIDRIVRWLRACRRIFFITGAGISADSGLPTYRGLGGLYNSGDTADGMSIEEALSGEMLRQRPEVTWKYLMQIEQNCRQAAFNRGHAVIAEMERHFGGVWILTQNIDGFHQAAGSRQVIDIHGDIHELGCMQCRFQKRVSDYAAIQSLPPRCPECGANLRPRVVLFGELLPAEKMSCLQDQLRQGFDLVFSIGTTSTFPYIAQPVLDAKRLGIPTVEINPEPTQVSHCVEVRLASRAAAALDQIWSRFHGKS